jgi:hypothetical protein
MGGQLREMGGKVGSAPDCYGSSLDSNPDISQKRNWRVYVDIATIAVFEMTRVLKEKGRQTMRRYLICKTEKNQPSY